MRWSGRERRWWIASLALILLIYSTLYFVRGPVEFLREHNLLRVSVWSLFAASGLAVALWLRRRGLNAGEGVVLAIFGLAFAYAVQLAERPEERLHFLQYGLLGGLLLEACRERMRAWLGTGRRSDVLAALSAMVLAALAGWGDEGIQAILPNRVYDLRDLVWNALGSSIVVAGLLVFGWMRRTD